MRLLIILVPKTMTAVIVQQPNVIAEWPMKNNLVKEFLVSV
jgi:hypothetical protein